MFKFTLYVHLVDILSIENHWTHLKDYEYFEVFRYFYLLQVNITVLILRESPLAFYWPAAQRIIQGYQKEI